MEQDRQRLSQVESDRIYARRIRPDMLDNVGPSPEPTAVLIGGQPGAGTSHAAAQVRTHLAKTVCPSVVISGDELRAYHPRWREHAHRSLDTAPDTQADVGDWYALVGDNDQVQRIDSALLLPVLTCCLT